MSWEYYKMMIMPNDDPREEIVISEEERKRLFRKYKNALLLRYTTNFDRSEELRWYYCIKDTPFDMDTIKSKRRNVLKKARSNFDVKEIDLADYIDQFHELRNDAFQAYPEPITFSYESSRAQCNAISASKTALVLGAFSKDTERLVGYLWLNFIGKSINMVEQHVMRDYEKIGCNVALDLAMCELYTQEYYHKGYYLSDGEKAIAHETAFHDFLIKYFGFRLAPCDLHVYFNPRYAFIVKFAIVLLPVYGGLLKRIRPGLYLNILAIKKLREQSA